jgi:hypothetical protein
MDGDVNDIFFGRLANPKIVGIYDAMGGPVNGVAISPKNMAFTALAVFTPSASGTYYVAVGARADYWGGGYFLQAVAEDWSWAL